MNLKEEVDNGQHGTAYSPHTKAASKAWHNGYRAACRDISDRVGLDTVDDIELMVKELREKVELHDTTTRGIVQQLNDEQLRLGKAELKIIGLEQTIEWMGNHVAEAKNDSELMLGIIDKNNVEICDLRIENKALREQLSGPSSLPKRVIELESVNENIRMVSKASGIALDRLNEQLTTERELSKMLYEALKARINDDGSETLDEYKAIAAYEGKVK